jgi:ABC-type multidrug transport system ATPase subunit
MGIENTLIEVHGLSKQFGRIAALTDVDFQVRAGELLGLIGPNGAGKSTLFECLAGVLPADSGTVRAGDRQAREIASVQQSCFMCPTGSPRGRRSPFGGRSISPSDSSAASRHFAMK